MRGSAACCGGAPREVEGVLLLHFCRGREQQVELGLQGVTVKGRTAIPQLDVLSDRLMGGVKYGTW